MPVPCRAEIAECLAGIRDDDLPLTESEIALRNDQHRALFKHRGSCIVAVEFCAADRNKNASRLYLAGIVRHACDLGIGKRCLQCFQNCI